MAVEHQCGVRGAGEHPLVLSVAVQRGGMLRWALLVESDAVAAAGKAIAVGTRQFSSVPRQGDTTYLLGFSLMQARVVLIDDAVGE